MKMMMKAVKATLALVLLCSAVFAQSLGDAQKAINAEQYMKAKDILKNLIKAKPAEPENYFYLGNVYLKDDYVDSAKATFAKGVSIDAEYALNYVGLGAVDLEGNNKAAAKANFEKAQSLVKKKDDGPALYTGKAYTWATNPDYDAALHYLENPANPKAAKVINPKDPEVFIAIGDAYRGRNTGNDLSSAYQNYQSALGLDNSLIRPKLELAIITKRAFAWNDAVSEFKAIMAANPNFAPAYRELAETYRAWAIAEPKTRDENMKLALQNYDKYMGLTDKSLESRIRHADFLVYAKEWKVLQQEAAEMAKISGTNDRILRYLGFAAFENKEFPTAEKALDQWIAKADPKRLMSEDYLFRGQAKANIGLPANDNAKIAQGLADLKKAVEMDSTNTSVVEDVAKALMTAKIYDLSADAYEIAATETPSLQNKILDKIYVGTNNYYYFITKYSKDSVNRPQGRSYLVKADSAFSNVMRLHPAYGDAHLWRARIAKELDDQKDPQGLSLPYWEKYMSTLDAADPANKAKLIDANKNIATYYTQKFNLIKSNPAAAPEALLAGIAKVEEYYNKVLALDPNDAYSKQVMDYVAQVKAALSPAGAKPAGGQPAPLK